MEELTDHPVSAKWLRLIDWLLCPAGKDRPQSVDAVYDWLEGNAGAALEAEPVAGGQTVPLTEVVPSPRKKRGFRSPRESGKAQIPKRSARQALDALTTRWFEKFASINGKRIGRSLAGLVLIGLLGSGIWFFGAARDGGTASLNPGALFVTADPSDAKVRFKDGKHQYRSGMQLEAGNYTLEISDEGYVSSEIAVAIEAGQEKRVEVNLKRAEAEKPEKPAVERPPRVATLPQMVKIDSGCFEMGSPEDEPGRSETERLHKVCVEGFSLGKYEVTVKDFRQFVEATAYRSDAETELGGKGCYGYSERKEQSGWSMLSDANWREPDGKGSAGDDSPVTCVSWNDANAYIRWLNRESGKQYGLPSEAEWEYTARGGERGKAYWGKSPKKACDYANVADRNAAKHLSGWAVHECDDGHAGPAPVGRFSRNRFGLYDMAGNVWEWTCSGVDLGYKGGEQKCEPLPGAWHILRGGSWADLPETLRLACRARNASAFRSDTLGFRAAL